MKIKAFLATIDGLSANTKRVYEQSLWQIHSASKGAEPTDTEIQDFLKEYAPASLHRHKAAIKAYLEFLGRKWPFTSRQFRTTKRRILRYASPDQIKDILEAGSNRDERMFVNTLFTLGCRISELMSIDPGNITPTGIRVVTKGGHENLKVITTDFYKQLTSYARKKNGNKLFPKTYTYYRMLLARLSEKAGHPGITPHMLRHGRAVDLLRKGMRLSDLQQFLGHATIATTAIYLQVTGGELTTQLEQLEGTANGHK